MSQQDSSQVVVTLPDGSELRVAHGTTVEEVAYRIGEGLGRDTVAGFVDDNLVDKATEFRNDSALEIVTEDSDDYLRVLRHSAAHVFAQAVLEPLLKRSPIASAKVLAAIRLLASLTTISLTKQPNSATTARSKSSPKTAMTISAYSATLLRTYSHKQFIVSIQKRSSLSVLQLMMGSITTLRMSISIVTTSQQLMRRWRISLKQITKYSV